LRLESISLTNFRNYDGQEILFHPRFNFFEGLNGQGKTNLLEAIYYLAVAHSFRTGQDHEIVNWNEEYFFLKGVFTQEKGRSLVEIGYQQPPGLKIKVDGKAIRRSEYIHRHPVIIFSPDDLRLVKEGPSVRRRFMNLEGSRLKPRYYRQLKEYHRVLQQRNRLLKDMKNAAVNQALFEPWDHALVALGGDLIRQRLSLLQTLEKQACFFYRQLSASAGTLSLRYLATVEVGNDPALIERSFSDRLKKTRSVESKRGCTMIGPHLDDFALLVDGYDAKKFGSQGQQRAAALALKMGEVNLFRVSTKETPVVLLDDVFSEFDLERRKQLLQFILDGEGQSFITSSTPIEQLVRGLNGGKKIFFVHKGKITVDRIESVN
jgi:DNA replication and repair protein RecF